MSAAAGTIADHLDLGEPVHAIDLLPDGGVVAGGTEGLVVITDPAGRERLRLHLDDFLLALAASPRISKRLRHRGHHQQRWLSRPPRDHV